ncbi:hypothetical protein ACH5RR_010288 [Cinchona calisaya]|uniref:Epidermal patterning factor-like protein n=1 Tax=Cinchona calisaya TaxID=153742 RepID=A0ABD3AHY7_9GENT
MEYYWKLNRRPKFMNLRRLIYYFVSSVAVFSLCTVGRRFPLETKSSLTGRADLFHLQTSTGGRKLLGGPGSSPPRCISKCGRCTPCLPVHIPVPPGTPVTAEYYPEAWRCKCGNKLYMP